MNTAKSEKQLRTPVDLSALPAWKARVEIAKDVIAALQLGALTAAHTYLKPSTDLMRYEGMKELRDLMGKGLQCQVCAVGAVLCAVVGREDNFSVASTPDSNFHYDSLQFKKILLKYFSKSQLMYIECVYEGAITARFGYLGEVCGQLAEFHPVREQWITYYPDRTCRMIAIMENIIRNKGTFRFDDLGRAVGK